MYKQCKDANMRWGQRENCLDMLEGNRFLKCGMMDALPSFNFSVSLKFVTASYVIFHMENLVQLRFHSYNLLKTARKDCSLVYNFAQTFVF